MSSANAYRTAAARPSRRRVLRRAAAAAAAPYIASAAALGGEGRKPAGDRITLGILGTGGRGTSIMKSILPLGGAQVVAVCDCMASRRKRAQALAEARYARRAGYTGCKAYRDFREVIARKDIDAVVIAPQDHWHALMVVAAARAGKHIYCEKPLGVAVAEGQAIRNAVRRYGRVFQTGTQQRSSRNFRFACELARNGYLGTIHTINVGAPGPSYQPRYRGAPKPEPVPDGFDFDMYTGPAPKVPYCRGRIDWPGWYLIWDYCAGFIVNWGVHHLDIAHWGCPAIGRQSVQVTCKGTYRTKGLSDNINDWQADMHFAGGLRMTFTDTGHPNKQGCEFVGDKGRVHVSRRGISAKPANLLKVTIRPNETHLVTSAHHQANFLQCVRTGRDPVSPVESGHVASTLGLVAEIATRLKRKLTWDPKAEKFGNDDVANRRLARPMRSPWTL